MTTNMSNAHKFALKKYPVKVIKSESSIDVNANKRKMAEQIYKDAEDEIISRASQWLMDHVNIPGEIETNEDGEPLAKSYIDHAMKRIEVANEIIEDFKNFMKGE